MYIQITIYSILYKHICNNSDIDYIEGVSMKINRLYVSNFMAFNELDIQFQIILIL